MGSDIFRLLIISVLIGGLVLSGMMGAGCLGFGTPVNETANQTNQTAPPPVVKNPTIAITSPLDCMSIETANLNGVGVTLQISTQNLVLKQPGGAAKKGEGHFRVTIDDGTPFMLSAKSYDVTGLGYGTHTIKVELLNNDNTPYSPAITKSVSYTISQSAPPLYVPQAYTVSITDFAYSPSELTVHVSDSVTFVNNGKSPRSATCFVAGSQVFDSKVLGPGQSATVTMDQVAECEYYATTFRALTGTMHILPNGNP